MAKKFDRAAEAFSKAAEMQFKLNSPMEAARCFADAATILKKTDSKGPGGGVFGGWAFKL